MDVGRNYPDQGWKRASMRRAGARVLFEANRELSEANARVAIKFPYNGDELAFTKE